MIKRPLEAKRELFISRDSAVYKSGLDSFISNVSSL